MMGDHTIPVPNPVELDGQPLMSITVRTPTPEDLAAVRRLNVGNYVRGQRLVARLTGLPPRTVSTILESNPDVAARVETFILPHL